MENHRKVLVRKSLLLFVAVQIVFLFLCARLFMLVNGSARDMYSALSSVDSVLSVYWFYIVGFALIVIGMLYIIYYHKLYKDKMLNISLAIIIFANLLFIVTSVDFITFLEYVASVGDVGNVVAQILDVNNIELAAVNLGVDVNWLSISIGFGCVVISVAVNIILSYMIKKGVVFKNS